MKLVLGTAMWGWTLDKKQCFEIINAFYKAGGRAIDTATNYPINKNPEDFRKAEKWLQEWILANDISDLQVTTKVGSLNNLMTPDHNLSKSFLLICLDQYLNRFKENLHTFMIHWDNRESSALVEETWQAMEIAASQGLQLGLSGIKFPGNYVPYLKDYHDLSIQAKHNVLYSDLPRYEALSGQRRFIAYGINAGGLKLNSKGYSKQSTLAARGGNTLEIPSVAKKLQSWLVQMNDKGLNTAKIATMNHIGLIYALQHPDIKQVLIGPSTVAQLEESMTWEKRIAEQDLSSFYDQIQKLVHA